ncbi:type II toxin-antitoxin system YafQ family toxin [Methylobacterium sp. J-030]|nr:type II toxin-antitoxin system YafQ family toxin [Methylobacterium sp. J-030]
MKRERKGRYRATVQADLLKAVTLLAADRPLPAHMVDHPLGGDWKNHRDCHIKPDLVLIYRKSDPPLARPQMEPSRPKLHLVRIGSHSELGL